MRQPNNNNNNNKNRMRGRGRGKQQNSNNRNFESNGPDVKIRGNAAHIAEKYTALARDALSAGDSVVAENYLQHAEHYNRIVMAAAALREEAQAAQARNNPQEADNKEAAEGADQNAGNSGEQNVTGERDEGANGQRRPQRRGARGEDRSNGRNTRRQSVEASDGEQEVQADNDEQETKEAAKPRTRRPARKKPVAVEGISEDAAALPQGLLGGDTGEETVNAEE